VATTTVAIHCEQYIQSNQTVDYNWLS